MRIIAGKYKGRKITCPDGKTIRPTSDMVRSAAFNILNNYVDWAEANVLDVCCGTGAFGIEALSRGAKSVGFIDNNRESLAATRLNLDKLPDEAGKIDIIAHAVENLPMARIKYDVIYVDPPYLGGLLPKALKSLKEKGWINDGAIILAELADREKLEAPEGFAIRDERRYGNTKLASLKLI